MQDEWGACTNDEDAYHDEVVDRCTVTCAKARGRICPGNKEHGTMKCTYYMLS